MDESGREARVTFGSAPVYAGQTIIQQHTNQAMRHAWLGKEELALLAGVLLALGAAPPAGAASYAPAAPSNLTATALATDQIQLAWSDNSSNESLFYLERAPEGFSFSVLTTVSANTTSYVDTGLDPGVTYAYRVRAWNSRGYSAYSNTASDTTLSPPAFSQSPASQAVVAGATVSFSVTATGTEPLGYQWQFNGTGLADATDTNLTLTNVQPADAGGYTVLVTNAEGAATSAVAVLTVLIPPALTTQPQRLTTLVGTMAGFSATATGTTPLAYQWRWNGLNLTNGGRFSGAATNALTIASVQSADSGSYTLVVSNAAGSVTSVVATLTVDIPPGLTLQPASQSVAVGNNVVFRVAAYGTPAPGFQWLKNGTGLADGANLCGTATASLRLAHVQTNDAGAYQVVVTNYLGAVTSTVASLTVVPPFQPAAQSAGVVVLVNSQSVRYLDFQHFIQPYLDNFGFPYTVLDITTNAPDSSISNCAVIIIGHSQLDTNAIYLDAAAQADLSLAVSNGTGLVSFDNDLYSGAAPCYQFVQDIFGFSYGTNGSGTNATLPPTEPSSQMHYITARHPTNDVVAFRSSLTLPGLTVPTNATTLVKVGGRPLVSVTRYGQGRAVQWASYDWMVSPVLGPVDGLDDVVWRGVVWAARKPVVMRGMPNFVTMRIDDAYGPFTWVHGANAVGFKPFIGLFYLLVADTNAADLATLTTSGEATASIHSTDTGNAFFYFNHATEQPWPDNVQSNNFYLGTLWHASHGIPISKICATHYSEIGLNCFAGLKAWGMEFFPIEVVPGTVEYATPGAPWLVGGPYRLYETPQPGQVNWPTYYADWLVVPGHPEFNGQFFNIYSEVRDVSSCGEWCPSNSDIAGSISRGTQIAKRALDSMVMATLFSHEDYVSPISAANWQAILQGITNNLAAYNPSYVTLDYASQYVRATRTSRLVSSAVDAASGQVTAVFAGKTDLDTQAYIFVGADSSITSSVGTVPAFSVAWTNPVVLSGPPSILNPPSSQTNLAGTTAILSVGLSGTLPLSYHWYQNGTNALNNGGQITGAGSATLTISNVLGGNAGSYTVMVSNALGSATSAPPAVLTVIDPAILSQPANQAEIAGASAVFSVGAYGTAPAYQWFKNGARISGATGTSLTLSNVSSGDAGSYSVTVSNAYGSVASSNASLAVFYVPVAYGDSYSVAAGTTLTVAAPGVLGNDTVEGVGHLTPTLVSGPIHGTLSLAPDGGFTYTPFPHYVGTDSFAYQAVNGPTNSAVATVALAINGTGLLFSDDFSRLADPGPLSPWVVQSGTWAVTGGALMAGTNTSQSYGYAYLTNRWTDYAIEGRIQFPAAGAWGGGLGGRLNPTTGAHYAAWVYPDGSPGGADVLKLIKFQSWTSFAYNGSSGAVMAQVSLAATGTNWHTVKLAFYGKQIAVYYDGTRVISLPDVEAQTYSSGGISAELWTAQAKYTMSVNDVMVRPLVADDAWRAIEDTTLAAADPGVLGNDTGVYATNLVAVLVSGPTNGTLTLGTNGGFTYSPTTNYSGMDSFSYQASQGSNSLGTATVTLTVAPPDAPMIIVNPSSRTNGAGTVALFSAESLGASPLSYQWFWNGTNALSDGGKISGAHSPTLAISNALGADAGSYTVVITNVFGGATSTPSAVLAVIDPVITAQPASQTNHVGGTAVFDVQVSGTAPQFQWYEHGQPVSGGMQAELVLAGVTDDDAGGFSVVVSNAYGSASSGTATLTVWDTPLITAVSAGGTNLAGTTAVMSVAALGAQPLNYQWYWNGTNALRDGPAVTGSASNVLTLVSVLGADGGSYTVVVSNTAGVAVSAPPAVLTVIDPVITAQPMSQTNIAGNTAVLSVQAYGTPPQYQWAKNGVPISGATQAALTLTGIKDSDAGGYSVSVSNAYGSVASATALLTVWDPPAITAPPTDETNLAGTTAVLSVEAVGTGPLSYQWYQNGTNALSDGAAVTGSASNILSLVNALGADDGAYRVVVSNVAGVVTSAPPALLTVIDPIITGQPTSQTNITGTTAVLRVQAEGTSPRCQWYKDGAPMSGATQAALTLTDVTDGDAGAYSVVISNTYGSVASATAWLTVWDPPVITIQPAGETNAVGATVVLSVGAAGTAPLAYQWYRDVTNALSDGTAVTGAASNVLSLVNVLGAADGAYTVVVSNGAGVVTSAPPAALTVIDPVITGQPASQTNSAGTTAVFSVQADGTAPQYEWYKDGVPLSGATQATLILTGITDRDAAGYSVIVSNAYGTAASATALLTVWDPPVITAQPAGGTNLAGAPAVLSVAAVGTGPLSYQWYRNVTNALSDGSAVTGSASNVLSLVNVFGADDGAYTVVVSNVVGLVTSTPPAVLTVIDPIITAQPASQTNIAGAAAVFSVQANGTTPQYQWLKNGAPMDGGTRSALTLTGVTDGDAGGYSVVVSNAYGSVTSATALLTVWDPPVITTSPKGGTNLAGATALLTVQAVGTGPLNYQWYWNVTNALADGSAVTGSASNGLSLINVLGADDGAYTVVVSNGAGVATSTPPAILTVIDPLITAQPLSQIYIAGNTAVVSVQAYGTAPQYQWAKNGVPLSGATQAALTLPGITDADAGSYSVVVSNAYGSATSATAVLRVWDPPVIMTPPTSATNAAGATTVLSVVAAGTGPLRYQWYRDVTNILSDGAGVIGSASNVLSLVNLLGAADGAYTVVARNGAGVVTSTPPAMLTVMDPIITAQPLSQTNHAGSTAVFSVQAYGTAPQYQWRKDGSPISGATQPALTLAGITDGDGGGYSVVVSNRYGSPTSDTASLTVVSRLSIESITLRNDGVTIGWNAVPGRNYLLQYQDIPAGTGWASLPPTVTAVGPSVLATNAFANHPQRFYRVILVP